MNNRAGSVYCDVNLRQAGFNGEEIRSGSVLVVKTHKSKYDWTTITSPKYNRKVYSISFTNNANVILMVIIG